MTTKTQTTPETFATVKAAIDKLMATMANCEVELGNKLKILKRDKLWKQVGCENFADCIKKKFPLLTVNHAKQLIKLYEFHVKYKLLLADTILPMPIVEELESIEDRAHREVAIRKVVHSGADYNEVVNIVDQSYGREADEPQSETEIQVEHEKEQEEAKEYYSNIDNCKQDALYTINAFKLKWDAINKKLIDKVLIDAVLDEEI
jgi:hypothetical protein